MKQQIFFFLTLLLFACLAQFSSDVYAPALPTIAKDLMAPLNHVQQTMAIYMLGMALSQPFYGPLSEGMGRKPPLLVGLVIMLIGSLFCVQASSIQGLMFGRFIQGLGAGSCSGLWRTIFRDKYSGEKLSQYGAYAAIIISFFIPAAPAIGGLLDHLYGWQAIFWLILGYVTLVIILVGFTLEETNLHRDKAKLSLQFVRSSFIEILHHRTFMLLSLSTFLVYGAFFSLYVVSPVLLIKYMGLKASHYGLAMFITSCIATLLGGIVNGRLVPRLGTETMLKIAYSTILIAAVLISITYQLLGNQLYLLLFLFGLFQFACMLVFPNLFAIAFENVGHIAGYAGSIYSLIQISGAAVIGWTASYLPDSTPIPLAIVILGSGLLSWLLLTFSKEKKCAD